MKDDNYMNVHYFENATMKGLYEDITRWQDVNKKRMLSLSIIKDGNVISCIALTNPSEVIICSGYGDSQAEVSYGCLNTR